MYYEPYEKKRGRKRRRPRGGCLGRLIGLLLKLLALALAVCAGLYFLPTSLMMVEKSEGLSPTDGLPGSPYNLLVLGVDTLSEGAQRSDTMMIASVILRTEQLNVPPVMVPLFSRYAIPANVPPLISP